MEAKTIAAKKKEQFLQQRLLDDVAECHSATDFEDFKHLIARDVHAAPGIPWALRVSDYRSLFVTMSFSGIDRWLREQGLALSLCFQGPADFGQPSLLSFIQVSFYESRGWTKSDALHVKQ